MKTNKSKWPVILMITGAVAIYLYARPTAPVTPTSVNLEGGTLVAVRLDRNMSSARSVAGEHFTGKLAKSILANGTVIVPEGTVFTGTVIEAVPAGRLAGGSSLHIALTSFSLEGKEYALQTTSILRTAQGKGKRTAEVAGGAAAIGAAIGALAHGGNGALIGAAIGAGVGAAGSAVTNNAPEIVLPTNSLLRFRLTEKVVITPKPVTPQPNLADLIHGLFS